MYSVNSEVGDETSCTILLLMHYYSEKCQRQHCISPFLTIVRFILQAGVKRIEAFHGVYFNYYIV